MKYWKGEPGTIKENQYGTMDNDGFVPDSIEISKQEYLDYIKNLPVPEPPLASDTDKLIQYAKKQKWI